MKKIGHVFMCILKWVAEILTDESNSIKDYDLWHHGMF